MTIIPKHIETKKASASARCDLLWSVVVPKRRPVPPVLCWKSKRPPVQQSLEWLANPVAPFLDHQIRGKRSGISCVLSALLRFFKEETQWNPWKSATGIQQPWPMHPIAYSCTASHEQLWGWSWKHWRSSCLGPCARVSISSKLTFEIAKITTALHLFFHAQEMFQDVRGIPHDTCRWLK